MASKEPCSANMVLICSPQFLRNNETLGPFKPQVHTHVCYIVCVKIILLVDGQNPAPFGMNKTCHIYNIYYNTRVLFIPSGAGFFQQQHLDVS